MIIDDLFSFPDPFTTRKAGRVISILPVTAKNLGSIKDAATRNRIAENAFKGQAGTYVMLHNAEGSLNQILVGTGDPVRMYDFSALADNLGKTLTGETLKKTTFRLEGDLGRDSLEAACTGWALGCHRYDFYKKDRTFVPPILQWPKGIRTDRVKSVVNSLCLLRNLVNTPSNDMGPAELEQAARLLAEPFKGRISVIKGAELEKGFPLIHAVGVSSPRAPRLIDLKWGKASDPKLTLVGKGVCFDTGGLNIKPGQYMLLMKKDMGGAAHALGLARAIMALNLPVRLRVLIPAVENSVSGTSFRPRDVYSSRKGLTVETSDTDAEGRLVLADALALACEEKPDLLMDFSTLTGSARAALGYDIPAVFSNNEKLSEILKTAAMKAEDPLWPLPLWQPYKRELSSDIADLNNIGTTPAGAITAALFLEHFIESATPWIHIDMYAWEQSGKPGRPRGGADTGLRAVLAFLEDRYAASKSKKTKHLPPSAKREGG